jgi:hypothetical protein
MEILVRAMEEDNVNDASNLDKYLMDFWEGDDNMDVDTLTSI